MRMFRRILALCIVVLILASPLVIWKNHYAISDWWRLQNYIAPAEIEKIADKTSMSSYGRQLFYVNRPNLDRKNAFNSDCSFPEATIVLGCYVPSRGIFILRVTDPRLNGIQEVTAAHEMLHAAYERLEDEEKDNINNLLQTEFTKVTDERVIKTIDGYRARDPGVVNNELHSILATEVRDIGPELHEYYNKYFIDRSQVVHLSAQYEQVFTDIKNRVDAYDAQLLQLKNQIERSQNELDTEFKHLQADRDALTEMADNEEFDAYNASVPEYNSNVRSYNANLNDLQQQIERYNALVTERNSVALEQRQLVQAIDSKALPQAP